MSNEHNTDKQRQPGQQVQQGNSANQRQPGQQDKSSKGYDTKSDRPDRDKEGNGKIATSAPGGE